GVRRHVVVPDVMMDELLVPDDFPSLDIEADDGVGIQIGAWTMSTVSIIGWRFRIQVNVSESFISGEGTPNAGVAGVIRGAVQPRFIARFAFAGDRVKDPQFLAGANIESQYVALHIFLVRAGAALSECRAH